LEQQTILQRNQKRRSERDERAKAPPPPPNSLPPKNPKLKTKKTAHPPKNPKNRRQKTTTQNKIGGPKSAAQNFKNNKISHPKKKKLRNY
jgi:hypothetical protein